MNPNLIPIICVVAGVIIYLFIVGICYLIYTFILKHNYMSYVDKKAHVIDICAELRAIEGNPLGIFNNFNVNVINDDSNPVDKFYIGLAKSPIYGYDISTMYNSTTKSFDITFIQPLDVIEGDKRMSWHINEYELMIDESLGFLNNQILAWENEFNKRLEKESK